MSDTPVLASPEAVAALFTRGEDYGFARWGRPIVPVVFGVQDTTLAVVKGAVEAVVALAGHKMAEYDPELGANLMLFFCRDWDELAQVPKLDRLIEGLPGVLERLRAQDARHYRMFRFDEAGAIRAVFVLVRIDAVLAEVPADVLALDQAVRMILLWSEPGLRAVPPLVQVAGQAVLRPEVAALIRAAYDPVLPSASRDPTHALRLFARMGQARGQNS